MIDPNTLPYRPCAGIMLLNQDCRVFVGRRIDTKAEAWQMPQGGIDPGETAEQAALRELLEEVGTDKAKVIAESKEWLNYDLPEDLIGKLWGGNYRGQTQKWFVLEFLGNDSDINIHTKNPEFHDWQWIEPTKLPELIVPFKQDLYHAVLEEFREFWQR